MLFQKRYEIDTLLLQNTTEQSDTSGLLNCAIANDLDRPLKVVSGIVNYFVVCISNSQHM